MAFFFKQNNLSDFSRNFAKVFTGNFLGGAIYAGSIPIIAKLYAVEQFGLFQILTSMTSTLAPLAMFNYEKLIVTTSKDEDIIDIIGLCFYVLSVSVAILGCVILLSGDLTSKLLDIQGIGMYNYLIIGSVFLEGLIFLVVQYTLRLKKFSNYAFFRVLNLSTMGVFPILFSFISPSFTSLFVSRIVAQLVAIFYLSFVSKFWKIFRFVNISVAFRLAKKNYRFPLFVSTSVFLNNFSTNLPVFLLAKYFGGETVGYYSMASRVVQMPLSIISSSFANVFFKNISDRRYNWEEFKDTYFSALKRLILLSVPIVIVLPLAPYICSLFLDQNWHPVGKYIQVLSFVFIATFVSSPISQVYIVLDRAQLLLLLSVLSIVIRYISIDMFSTGPPITALLSYSVFSSGYYILLIFVVIYLIYYRWKVLQ